MADALETPAPRVRARALDLPLGRFRPGRFNAITDVDGVLVGHTTLIARRGSRCGRGKGPVRTGVTAIVPSGGNIFMERLHGGGFVLNGAGEVSGMTQVMEWGLLETPILLTNTMSVGAVSDAVARLHGRAAPGHRRRARRHHPGGGRVRRQLAQRHRRPPREGGARALEAIATATDGPVAEGSVGGGTGMVTCDFKAGIGTVVAEAPRDRTAATRWACW